MNTIRFTFQKIAGAEDGDCNVWATNEEGRVEYIGQLCRNWSRLGGNGWSVPGGSLNLGKTRKQAAMRLYKRDGLIARDYRANLDAKEARRQAERVKVFNPEGIAAGDTVRIADPREGSPLGDMIVEGVGGKNGNKVYCKQVGHELYANCFKLVAKKGSAEQTGFGVPAQTPAQASADTAARRRQRRIDLLLRLQSDGRASSAESAELRMMGVWKKDWAVTFVRPHVETDVISAYTREQAERIAEQEFGKDSGHGLRVIKVEEAK